MDDVERFLSALDKTLRGRMHLVNIWDSCEENLLTPKLLRAFLKQAADLWKSRRGTTVIDPCMALAKTGERRNVRGKFAFLRIATISMGSSTAGHGTWSRIDRWDSFYRFHLAVSLKSTPIPGVPILSNPPHPRSKMSIQRDLNRVIARPDWIAENATLGLPVHLPANCWVADTPIVEADEDMHCANLNRDERGLKYDLNDHLVAYEFDFASAVAAANTEIARPTFADGGNDRFRVKDISGEGRMLALNQWGSTVHLGKLAVEAGPDRMHGASERVTCGLPIAVLSGLRILYLGRVTEPRGNTVHDDNQAFVRVLLRKRSRASIKRNILSYLV